MHHACRALEDTSRPEQKQTRPQIFLRARLTKVRNVFREKLRSERLDARGKTGEFPRNRFRMKDAFRRCAMQLRLRGFERGFGRRFIAGRNRFLDLAQEGAHARTARFVHCGAARNLADHLLGGSRVSHVSSLGFLGPPGGASGGV